MAVLLIELHGIKRGCVLPRRVLIGRRSMNHLVIDDAGVSRMHAWIDGEGDRFYINDAGSRTGTCVNGQRIIARHLLGDADEITIGPAKLTFLAESRLRPGVEPIDLASPPKIAPAENGIPFDCTSCKAPLWASPNFAGGTGQCKYCGNDVVVPKLRAAKAQPATAAHATPNGKHRGVTGSSSKHIVPPARSAIEVRKHTGSKDLAVLSHRGSLREGERLPSSREDLVRLRNPSSPSPALEHRKIKRIAAAANGNATLERPPAPAASVAMVAPAHRRTRDATLCGVCQSTISAFEEQTSCPSCGLIFHADCWTENYGCSAYGCAHVNALAPQEEHHHATHELEVGNAKTQLTTAGADPADKPARFPWEFLLLAGSVFAALIGALTFGLPSLALAGGTVTYMARTRGSGDAHRGIIILSAGLALLGVIAGIPVSWFLYFGGPHS